MAGLSGCGGAGKEGKPISVKPTIQLVNPERRDLHRDVGQPGYIYAFEQTLLYPKITGFIDKYHVDIGDTLKKGQPIADLFVPELHARYREKKAMVKLSKEKVDLAERMVEVAESNVQVAAADVLQAKADLNKYEANVERWESEVKRLASITEIVNVQVLEELRKQLKANLAALSAGQAAVTADQARELARKSDLAKAKVDVNVARAQVEVDQAGEENLAALVGYTHLLAPYDGIVINRNANVGDYVEPRDGDASAPAGGDASELRTQGTPIFIVARTDLVRVYVDVPAVEANYVQRGTKARVRVSSDDYAEFPATVTRTSWALDYRSRTLRAEIDLPNKGEKLRPGMYAYGLVEIARHGVLTVPMPAVLEIGNEICCYLYEDGKAIRTPVQTGMNDGKYVEIFRKNVNQEWQPFTGKEEVIVGDLAGLRDGEKVHVQEAKAQKQNNIDPANKGKQ